MQPDAAPQTNPQPPAAVAPKQEHVPLPDTWPGAFKIYKNSKQAVITNLSGIVVFYVLSIVVSFVLSGILKEAGSLLGDVFSVLVTAIVTYLYIAGVRGQKVEFGDAFSKGVKVWLNMFFLNVVVVFTVILSIIALIIPVFFVAPRLALANYFLVDKGMGFMDAYKASWHATKGNVGKVYGILGANVAMALLCITIIGIPFSIYFLVMYSAATAVLYEIILKQQGAAPVANPPVQQQPTAPAAPAV